MEQPVVSSQDIDDQLKINKETEEKILSLFNYIPQWRQYPLEDCREYHWRLLKDGSLYYSSKKESLLGSKDILCDRVDVYPAFLHHSPDGTRLEFRKAERALLVYDTQCDGNVYLGVWDTTKEVVSRD